jgi:hypothetical protein
MPSSSFRTTSDGTPRIVDVTGATVAVGQIRDGAVAGEHEGRSFLVGRGKLVKTNLAAGYSSGHVASDSQARASARACGSCE